MQGAQLNNQLQETILAKVDQSEDSIISFQVRLPLPLNKAMNDFIELYPNWDQYRLIHAALAGFLIQNGMESRSLNRLYIGNMFGLPSLIQGDESI